MLFLIKSFSIVFQKVFIVFLKSIGLRFLITFCEITASKYEVYVSPESLKSRSKRLNRDIPEMRPKILEYSDATGAAKMK